MKIVIPSEVFPAEKRVMVLPQSVKTLVDAGHKVFVQTGASKDLDVSDAHYANAGAKIITESMDLYAIARSTEQERGMVIKLKAPTQEEFSMMNDTILFCMLHVEQNKERIYYMGSQNITGIAMERVQDEKKSRLVDQTDITGRTGVYYALNHLLRQSGKMPEEMVAVILGYGNVSTGAISACAQLGMDVKIVRRREFEYIPIWLKEADILINGISWPEKKRQKLKYLVKREDIQNSKPSLVVLDLAVDLPSPVETIVKATDYLNPYYLEEGRVHISIYGYPGLVPVTSSKIYSAQVLPLALTIANNEGLENIQMISDFGRYICTAVVDPKAYKWESFRPLVPEVSNIE